MKEKVLEVTDRDLEVLYAACRYFKARHGVCVVGNIAKTGAVRIKNEELSVLMGRIEQIRLDL